MHDTKCHFNGTLLINVLPSLLGVEFVLGSLANGLALWIFCCHLKPWKSSTVLIFNLAVADFLLITVLPLRASYYYARLTWRFGEAMCNICLFMLAMNRTGSTVFLMAIAGDRYMRVVHPHHPINSLSVPKAACAALGLWLITIAMTAHVFSLEHANTTYCESFMVDTEPHHNLSWHKFEFLFSFLIPLVMILYCTVRIVSKLRRGQLGQHAKIKKALWLLMVVVVLFTICFFPSNLMQVLIWIKTHKYADLPVSEFCPALEGVTNGFFLSISLTYFNSVLDPIIYYFSSPAIQNLFRKTFHLPQTDTAESTERRTRETGSLSLSQL
ncbi:hypothetical protein fugu_003878 [Takifugu bimaculatus]|uniref:G-protein coupled receptors family 1 profile domain-containing protein n=1 Tax=Takifugu bimaculatus TaxID=433685 RepID=A0A4Z2BB61_9TELE|nr:hypothetical protein fugu_003878 [Takifugu bimaculatus]